MQYIRWIAEDGSLLRSCEAQEADTIMYTSPDGLHFLPLDGQSIPAWPPEPEDQWYCMETGQPAIVGLSPTAPLCILC